jgi:nucleotide-binding universal stress UspA family protein
MFERLLVVTDLSKYSSAVINSLGEMKYYGAEKCLLLQCMSIGGTIGMSESYNSVAFSIFEKTLQKQKESLEKQGYAVETRVLSGDTKDDINSIAAEEDYSLIIVNAQQHSVSGKVFFNPVADDLIHAARKPILLARLKKKQEKEMLLMEEGSAYCEIGDNILFPTDFSDNAGIAFDHIVKMVSSSNIKKITLIHVQDKSRLSPYLDNRVEEFNEVDNSRLQSMKDILRARGDVDVNIILKYGFPSVEILNAVRDYNIGLVVMGSQGRGYVKEFFLGSVSHNIARNSPSSVLLIPAKR